MAAILNFKMADSQWEMTITEFEGAWPDGFYDPIKKKIVTFADSSKHMKINGQVIPDPETVHQRVISNYLRRNLSTLLFHHIYKYTYIILIQVVTSLQIKSRM